MICTGAKPDFRPESRQYAQYGECNQDASARRSNEALDSLNGAYRQCFAS